MLEKLRELGIRDELIREITEYRETYQVEQEYGSRIPKLEQFYYGKEVWEQAITAILCGENILLAGPKATGKSLFAENLAGVFARPRWDVSFHVNMDAASLIGMDTFRGERYLSDRGRVYTAGKSRWICHIRRDQHGKKVKQWQYFMRHWTSGGQLMFQDTNVWNYIRRQDSLQR